MMASPLAFLFDLDGTLADTAPDLLAALNVMRAERGMEPLPRERLAANEVANGSRSMMRAHLVEDGEDIEPLRERFLEAYDAVGHKSTRLFDGFPEVLDHLDVAGIPWSIVTNKPTAQTLDLLPVLGLQNRFAALVCGDTFPTNKPDPIGLLSVCEQLSLEPGQCLFVGDAQIDVQAASTCAMPFVAAGWGYLDGPAEVVLDRPGQLLDLL